MEIIILFLDSPVNSSKSGTGKAIENLIMYNCNNSAYDWFIDRSDTFNYWLANPDTDQWPATSIEEGGFSTVKQVCSFIVLLHSIIINIFTFIF